jgi:hypothetical protein
VTFVMGSRASCLLAIYAYEYAFERLTYNALNCVGVTIEYLIIVNLTHCFFLL